MKTVSGCEPLLGAWRFGLRGYRRCRRRVFVPCQILRRIVLGLQAVQHRRVLVPVGLRGFGVKIRHELRVPLLLQKFAGVLAALWLVMEEVEFVGKLW
jgi:hypothetical protein